MTVFMTLVFPTVGKPVGNSVAVSSLSSAVLASIYIAPPIMRRDHAKSTVRSKLAKQAPVGKSLQTNANVMAIKQCKPNLKTVVARIYVLQLQV